MFKSTFYTFPPIFNRINYSTPRTKLLPKLTNIYIICIIETSQNGSLQKADLYDYTKKH